MPILAAIIAIITISLSCTASAEVHEERHEERHEEEGHTYYIAGAYSYSDSKAYLDVMNPWEDEASISVYIYYERNDTGGMQLKIDPHSTARTDLSRVLESNFGLMLKSDRPVIIDSVQYDSTYSGGFGSQAESDTGFVWYFGEGYSSGMAKTYLYLLNPGRKEANVGVTLYYDNGQKKTFNTHVPAEKHVRIDLKEKTQPEKRFGIKVTSTSPIVASAGNFNRRSSAAGGGHGSARLSKTWHFPDGHTSVEASDFLNLVNPSLGVAHVTMTIYYDDGTERSFDETVQPNAKRMIMLNNHVKEQAEYSLKIESDVSIAADMTHDDDDLSAGHGGPGMIDALTEQHFAYALSDSMTTSRLAIFNPSEKEAELDLTFHYEDGTVKKHDGKAPSKMRTTIKLDEEALQGRPYGLTVRSTEPVFARQTVYDRTRSAGHGYNGIKMQEPAGNGEAAEEEDERQDKKDTFSAEEGNGRYTLIKEEVIAPDRFDNSMQQGLEAVQKFTYDHDGKSLVAWRFGYADSKDAQGGLEAALSGKLFTILESRPERVGEAEAHYYVSEDTTGYVWQNADDLYLFVAQDSEDAAGLAEMFINSSEPSEEGGAGLGTILLIIFALIIFIIFIRWIFKGTQEQLEELDEEDVWEEQIPSAKPKPAKKRKKSPVRFQKKKKSDAEKAGKLPEKKQKKTRGRSSKKKEEQAQKEKTEEKKEQQKETRKEQGNEEKKDNKDKKKDIPEEPRKNEKAGEKKISIKEIPRDKLTAQDILDDLEEIPEYEDVFRHVNREQEEIKPK